MGARSASTPSPMYGRTRDLGEQWVMLLEKAYAKAHGSYEALAADDEIDIVYIATPHPMHAENALLLLEHGKHVLIEKPFTLNADQAIAVRDLARAKGLLAMDRFRTNDLDEAPPVSPPPPAGPISYACGCDE